MRKPRSGAAAALALCLLAGCIGTPDPVTPGPGTGEWTSATGSPWVAYSYGCGFCSGSPEMPEYHAVVLYRSGQVLVVDYAQASQPGVQLQSSGLEPWRDTLELAFATFATYAERDGVRIHAVATETIAAHDLERVANEIDWGLSRAEGPERGELYTDCGPDVIETVGPPLATRVEVGCGIEGGVGWEAVRDQMAALDAWVERSPHA